MNILRVKSRHNEIYAYFYLILAIVMIFFANQMLQVKDNLEKKVLGTYVRQFEEINKATGMDVYNLKGETNYEETLKALEEIQ